MNKTIKNIILFLLASCIFLACNNSDSCLQGAGKTREKTVEITEFSSLHIHGIFVIELQPDTCNKITMRAGKNLLESVKTEQNTGALHLYNSSRCAMFKGFEKIHLRIHFSNIDTLNILEACEITTLKPITNNLTIQMMASMCDIHISMENYKTKLTTLNKAGGSIELEGKSVETNLTINYTAQLNAGNLQTETTTIVSNSLHDCTVNASKKLHATANRNGAIIYAGNPIEVIAPKGKVVELRE